LGKRHRREALLGDRRHRAGARRRVLPALFDRSRLAVAASRMAIGSSWRSRCWSSAS
jgi:hypothetical protein